MKRASTYEQWMAEQDVPVVRGHGVTDVRSLAVRPWQRMGGAGAFIHLQGMEGLTGMYVAEIPPAGALSPERHLYDEVIYVLSGRGTTQIWSDGSGQPVGDPLMFEWQAGSLFAPPLNTWHRLLNGSGTEPVRFLAVTSAPIMLDMLHNPHFIFNCDYRFSDRYDGRRDYFHVGDRRPDHERPGTIWDTNFIPDVRTALIDEQERKGAGVRLTLYEMAGNVLMGHMAEWPVGRYHKAHYHGGGAILLIVRSSGYTLMWPPEAGIQPYASGHADQVVKVDWQEGSVLSPPSGWFHQHFNTGAEPARQLAIRYGSHYYKMEFHNVYSREGTLVSVRQGGTLIEYEDEDPEIRRTYRRALENAGVEYRMPVVSVRA